MIFYLDYRLKGGLTLNNIIQNLITEVVEIEVSGKKMMNGTLVDSGSDLVVLFNGIDFVYISLEHIQRFEVNSNEDDIMAPTHAPTISTVEDEKDLSFREILTQAKGNYVELYVTDGPPIHGYILSLMDDYIEFYSPVYKIVYVSLRHLKVLIPYAENESPYGKNFHNSLVQSSRQILASTFKQQIEKFKDKIVVLNAGGNKSHIGKLNEIEENLVEIHGAKLHSYYLNLDHIKTLHLV